MQAAVTSWVPFATSLRAAPELSDHMFRGTSARGRLAVVTEIETTSMSDVVCLWSRSAPSRLRQPHRPPHS